jgi:hypothetical protein
MASVVERPRVGEARQFNPSTLEEVNDFILWLSGPLTSMYVDGALEGGGWSIHNMSGPSFKSTDGVWFVRLDTGEGGDIVSVGPYSQSEYERLWQVTAP